MAPSKDNLTPRLGISKAKTPELATLTRESSTSTLREDSKKHKKKSPVFRVAKLAKGNVLSFRKSDLD